MNWLTTKIIFPIFLRWLLKSVSRPFASYCSYYRFPPLCAQLCTGLDKVIAVWGRNSGRYTLYCWQQLVGQKCRAESYHTMLFRYSPLLTTYALVLCPLFNDIESYIEEAILLLIVSSAFHENGCRSSASLNGSWK